MIMWFSKKEREAAKKLAEQQERYLMGIDPIPESEPDSNENKKWAWIIVDGERQMAWVDNVTMKAYKADGYDYTDIEIPEFEFERWCRPMDL